MGITHWSFRVVLGICLAAAAAMAAGETERHSRHGTNISTERDGPIEGLPADARDLRRCGGRARRGDDFRSGPVRRAPVPGRRPIPGSSSSAPTAPTSP